MYSSKCFKKLPNWNFQLLNYRIQIIQKFMFANLLTIANITCILHNISILYGITTPFPVVFAQYYSINIWTNSSFNQISLYLHENSSTRYSYVNNNSTSLFKNEFHAFICSNFIKWLFDMLILKQSQFMVLQRWMQC